MGRWVDGWMDGSVDRARDLVWVVTMMLPAVADLIRVCAED